MLRQQNGHSGAAAEGGGAAGVSSDGGGRRERGEVRGWSERCGWKVGQRKTRALHAHKNWIKPWLVHILYHDFLLRPLGFTL